MEPQELVLLELGDAEILVSEHADGMITIEQSNEQIVLTVEQFGQYLEKLQTLGRDRGWLAR